MWKKQDMTVLDNFNKKQTIYDIPPDIAEQFKNVAVLRKN